MTERPFRHEGPAGDSAKEILRVAASHGATDVVGLVHAVPSMLAEAERRRRLASAPGARIFAAARVFVPRLAVATMALVLAAVLLSSGSSGSRSTEPADGAAIERFILTGSAEAGASDPVLDALVHGEER